MCRCTEYHFSKFLNRVKEFAIHFQIRYNFNDDFLKLKRFLEGKPYRLYRKQYQYVVFEAETRSHFEKSAWKESARKFRNCTLEQKFANRLKPEKISGHFPSGGDQVPPNDKHTHHFTMEFPPGGGAEMGLRVTLSDGIVNVDTFTIPSERVTLSPISAPLGGGTSIVK